ncbi:MAG: CAAX prenyl protease-related protein [Bryobacteraceae bacterium]|jgi:CAAX prenyl protease-like protein
MTVSRQSRTTLAYVAPFGVYVASMGLERLLGIDGGWLYALRCSLTLAAILVFSRRTVSFTALNPISSAAVGLLVFILWVAPDQLWNIRHHWLFENALTGAAVSSIPIELRRNVAFLILRVGGSALLVPIIEELFWRAWLMRWMISEHIETVPLGTYRRLAFWVTAALFAAEHGPYWEVGLVAGIVYNWWMVRTRSLGDCILAHAVTNLALGLYVIGSGQWQYWL